MPELPEVEFARRCLRRWLVGRTLVRASADAGRLVDGGPAALARLAGRRVEDVLRRGKQLLWRLDAGAGLLAHLGMTGRFVLRPAGKPERYSRARFVRDDGWVVHLRDPRRFGRLVPGPVEQLVLVPAWSALGPDAWDDAPKPAVLAARIAGRRRAIKDVLLDQTVVAGLGNIQATDALFYARIHPNRPANSVERGEVRRLAAAIRRSLAESLQRNDGDEIAYLADGDSVENPFVVYGRAGEPCPRCRATLRAMDIGGRTSAFCAACQR